MHLRARSTGDRWPADEEPAWQVLLDADEIAELLVQVPGTFVHHDLGELATHLLERDHLRDSQSGGLR